MENMHTITLASRIRVGKENKGALYNVLISLIFFLSDLSWFLFRRAKYDFVRWWEVLFLIISSVLLIFSLLGLAFSASNKKYNEKIIDVPLIAYDEIKKVFVVQSFYEMKEVELRRNEVLSIKINNKTNEAILNYLSYGVEKMLNIGYGDCQEETRINELINEYKYK